MRDADAARWDFLIAQIKADLARVTPPPVTATPRTRVTAPPITLARARDSVPAGEDWDLAIARAKARLRGQPSAQRLSAHPPHSRRG
jgi:hypothetical protein